MVVIIVLSFFNVFVFFSLSFRLSFRLDVRLSFRPDVVVELELCVLPFVFRLNAV